MQATIGFSLNGVLLNASGRYPLAGLHVFAYYVEPEADLIRPKDAVSTGPSETLLGEGISSYDGHFGIVFRNSPLVEQRLCLLRQCPDSAVLLKVCGEEGSVYFVSSRLYGPRRSLFIELSVPLPLEELSLEIWRQLSGRLLAARVAHLEELVRQLVLLPPGQSLFADWSLIRRQSVLAALEAAFLDPRGLLRARVQLPRWNELSAPGALEAYQQALLPHIERDLNAQTAFRELLGKVTRFSDLASVDWVIDPIPLVKGDIGAALTRFQEQYQVIGPGIVPVITGGPSDLSRYRDYLREIWIATITQVEYGEPQSVHRLTRGQALVQLQTRFHQDFVSLDISETPVNEVLIPIIISILTAPRGGQFGFGLPATAIPPRNGASPRQYLNMLIELSGCSAQQLGLRYRIDLERSDALRSNRVWENILTLQSFFCDGFQCGPEPIHVDPDVLNQPIVPDALQGKAPFFLEYEEWLRNQEPIAFENFLQIREIFKLNVSASNRSIIERFAECAPPGDRPTWQFYVDCFALQDEMKKGYDALDHNEFKAARAAFEQAHRMTATLLENPIVELRDISGEFATQKTTPIKSLADLHAYMGRYQVHDRAEQDDWEKWRDANLDRLPYALVYLAVYVLPTCISDAALFIGDYPAAVFAAGKTTRFQVAKAGASDLGGYRPYYLDEWAGSRAYFRPYHAGNLPYTVNLERRQPKGYPPTADDDSYHFLCTGPLPPDESYAEKLVETLTHPVEVQYFRLRQGNVMLEWADVLYRSNEPANIARARELYKGVLFLHGRQPQISSEWPEWSAVHLEGGLVPTLSPINFINGYENPAKMSQAARGWLGFIQIDSGLNYFGYTDDMMPTLRYRTLKEAADRLAAQASAAQHDFLDYMIKVEEATLENIKRAAMLRKVELQARVAAEQARAAQAQMETAQVELAEICAEIGAKQQELADRDSLPQEFGCFLTELVDLLKGRPEDPTAPFGAPQFRDGSVEDLQMSKTPPGQGPMGRSGASASLGGLSMFESTGMLSVSSMAHAAARRTTDLHILMGKILPAAQAQLDAAKHALSILGLKQQIAQADADLLRDVMTFQSERFLSIEFWANLATLLKRVLRRYLEVATRAAWLAERALAHEQGRQLHIIRFDYFPAQLQRISGADLLQLDLAELGAAQFSGLKETISIKHTFSLLRDFPLQFAELRRTGRCCFHTEELPLRRAYPGTYGYRILSVTPTILSTRATLPLYGMLLNQGISIVSTANGETSCLTRSMEAMPLSQGNAYRETATTFPAAPAVLPFEDSGIDTIFALEFHASSNPTGLDAVSDILLSFDLRARYSPNLYHEQIQAMPTAIERLIFMSAKRYQPQQLKDLQGSKGRVTLDFDLRNLALPKTEMHRRLKNLVLLAVASVPLHFQASLAVSNPVLYAHVNFTNNIAFSNAPPLSDSQSHSVQSPLNVFVEQPFDQVFHLVIDKDQNPNIPFDEIGDLIFGVEYLASLCR